jgi:hypothetical protein
LWDEALPWSSVTLPRWGMTRTGVVLQHPTSERPISATGSGLWQTPVADDACNRATGKWNSRGEPKLSAQVQFSTPTASMGERGGRGDLLMQVRGNPSPSGRYALPMWPTPTADNFECKDMDAMLARRERVKLSSGNGNGFGLTLGNAVKLWPTPLASDGNMTNNPRKDGRQDQLPNAVARFPTPTKSDHKGSGPTMLRSDGKMRGDRLDYALERNPDGSSTGGQLNPTWVEWLMGWPLGWTDLKPLAMDKFREWQQQHGGF